MPKAAANLPPLITVPLEQVTAEHETVHRLRNESCGETREAPEGTISTTNLIQLASQYPIHVCPEKGKLACFAGLKPFRLLKAGLASNTEVPVFVHERLRAEQLEQWTAFDLLIAPMLFAIHTRDRKRMGRAWDKFRGDELFTLVNGMSGRQALSKLIGCDPRTLEE